MLMSSVKVGKCNLYYYEAGGAGDSGLGTGAIRCATSRVPRPPVPSPQKSTYAAPFLLTSMFSRLIF